MPYGKHYPHLRSENDPRRTRNLRPDEREERQKLIGQLHQLLNDRRQLERELHALEQQGPRYMPNITAQYRRSIDRMTARIKRLDNAIAAIERRPVDSDNTPTGDGENEPTMTNDTPQTPQTPQTPDEQHDQQEEQRQYELDRITYDYAEELRAGKQPRIDDYVRRYPQYEAELLEIALWLACFPPECLIGPMEATLSPAAERALARIRAQRDEPGGEAS